MSRPLGSNSRATSGEAYPKRVNNYEIVNDYAGDPAAVPTILASRADVARFAAACMGVEYIPPPAEPANDRDPIAAALSTADAPTRRRLRQSATTLTDGADIVGLLDRLDERDARQAAEQAAEKAAIAFHAKVDARAARDHEAAEKMAAAMAILDRLDALPTNLINAITTPDRQDGALQRAFRRRIADGQRAPVYKALHILELALECVEEWVKRRQQAKKALSDVHYLPRHQVTALIRLTGEMHPKLRAVAKNSTARSLQDKLAKEWIIYKPTGAEILVDAMSAVFESIRPPKDEATNLGVRLCDGDEDAIRKVAEDMSAIHRDVYAHEATRAKTPDYVIREHTDPKWWHRRLRREAKLARAYLDVALRTARPGSEFVGPTTLEAFKGQLVRNQTWAENTRVVFKTDKGLDAIPMNEIQDSQKKAKCAQMYASVRTMEHIAETRTGHKAFFITPTLPSEYHPFACGKRAANGSHPNAHVNKKWDKQFGPRAARRMLNNYMALLRANLAKHKELRDCFGIVVPEPHIEGTPHLHAMMWLPPTFDGGRDTEEFLRSTLARICPGDKPGVEQCRVQVIERDAILPDGKKAASPASYVMTYVIKAIAADDEKEPEGEAPNGEEHVKGEGKVRYRAWKNSREMRGVRLLGVHGALSVLHNLWPKTDRDGNPVMDKRQLPPRARRVQNHMLASQQHTANMHGHIEEADLMDHDGDHIGAAVSRSMAKQERYNANEAMALALGAAGALDCLADEGGGALQLMYEDGVTKYGRPTRKAAFVRDTLTKQTYDLKTSEAEVMSLADWKRAKGTPDKATQPTDEEWAEYEESLPTPIVRPRHNPLKQAKKVKVEGVAGAEGVTLSATFPRPGPCGAGLDAGTAADEPKPPSTAPPGRWRGRNFSPKTDFQAAA